MLDPSRIAEIADELAAADRDRTTVPLLTPRKRWTALWISRAKLGMARWADGGDPVGTQHLVVAL
jgi:2-oxo-hept-3-ene-1,7-dioate hydratase